MTRTARIAGITLGVGSQLLVGVCAWQLFWFLHGGVESGRLQAGEAAFVGRGLHPLLCDTALLLQFTVAHSLLLWPPTQKRLKRWIPGEFYGCFFAAATSLSLLLLIACWRTSPVVFWQVQDSAATAVHVGYYLSWIALIYTLGLTGFGYQTGWTQWRHWFLGRKLPRRTFQPRGAYHWMRHPVYASVLGLIWLTPCMTLDHALLTGLWTVYVFYGSYLKDERLVFYLGDDYRRYQARVIGYPLMLLGPLGKRRFDEPASDDAPFTSTINNQQSAIVIQEPAVVQEPASTPD
jgi:protein-S-isoprenylcysteine O-methyltransferase Ste14